MVRELLVETRASQCERAAGRGFLHRNRSRISQDAENLRAESLA